MMICPKCHTVMKHVYRFTPDRNSELDICSNCYFETKPKALKFSSIEIIQDNTRKNTKENEKPKIKKPVNNVKKKNIKLKNKINKKRKKGRKK